MEMLEAGTRVRVHVLGSHVKPADLMIIGSHCIGLDYMVRLLQQQQIFCKFIPVGSQGGIMAVKRGECDIAGSHLLDEKTRRYNQHLLDGNQELVKGYKRKQGILYRLDDCRFDRLAEDFDRILREILNNPDVRLINRNRGSGTRVLLDQLMGNHRPAGFFSEAKSHNAVAATIAQGRADWGMAIETVGKDLGLGFFPMQDEEYDFVISKTRLNKPAVRTFLEILDRPTTQEALAKMGLIR